MNLMFLGPEARESEQYTSFTQVVYFLIERDGEILCEEENTLFELVQVHSRTLLGKTFLLRHMGALECKAEFIEHLSKINAREHEHQIYNGEHL